MPESGRNIYRFRPNGSRVASLFFGVRGKCEKLIFEDSVPRPSRIPVQPRPVFHPLRSVRSPFVQRPYFSIPRLRTKDPKENRGLVGKARPLPCGLPEERGGRETERPEQRTIDPLAIRLLHESVAPQTTSQPPPKVSIPCTLAKPPPLRGAASCSSSVDRPTALATTRRPCRRDP